MGKRPKGPPIVNGPYHHHRHQDSSHMTTSRSAAVHQQLAHSRAMRFRLGQRAASRLGADLHAKRLGKLETLYPLCEGFLQPPPCAFCTTTSQTHGLISGPASRSHVAWTSSRSDVVLHYHRPGATLFMSDIPGTLYTKIAAHMLATTCNSNVFLYTTTREHLASPGASVSREGFAILEWTSP